MTEHLVQRQTSSPFDPKAFYIFSNAASAGNTLSNGISWSSVNMTKKGAYSSENWQVYYQQGRYFLRNYDFQTKSHYGLGSWRFPPGMEKASGSLGHQWTLTKEEDGWILTNGLIGNNSYLALVEGNNIPVMSTSKRGAVWQIEMNIPATTPKDPAMLLDVANFEVCMRSITLGYASLTI